MSYNLRAPPVYFLSGKILSCKPHSLVYSEPSAEDFPCSTQSLASPARVLGLSLTQLGLCDDSSPPSAGGSWGFGGNTPSEKISNALRAALRDVGASLQSPIRDAARDAASQLLAAVEKCAPSDTPSASVTKEGFSPVGLVRRGALGSRAAAAMVSAFSQFSLAEREAGLQALQATLQDEVFRARATRNAVLSSPAEDSGGVDEWLLRLCTVQALLECRREAEALEESQRAVKFAETELLVNEVVPGGCCSQLLLGICLLRRGRRAEGFSALEKALRDSPPAGQCDQEVHWLAGLGHWTRIKAQRMLHINQIVEQLRSAAVDAYTRGAFDDAAVLYGKAIAQLQVHLSDDKRGRAVCLADRAGCLRRARKLDDAIVDLDAALRLFPRYSRAIYRRAACLLEAGKATEAVEGFKDLYRVDRNWPNLSEWLVRAFSLQKRQARGYHKKGQEEQYEENMDGGNSSGPTTGVDSSSAGGTSEADVIAKEVDHYTVLGVSTDATEKQLKTAYRVRSLKFHPDKKGGHTAAFQRIAEAYEVLSDEDKRRTYDEGGDIRVKRGKRDADDDDDSEEEEDEHKTTMREEVEREFYPERYHFWPFGKFVPDDVSICLYT